MIERNDDVVHIGDDPEADFAVPKGIGINAIYLNRKGNDLEEIVDDLIK
jgi:hypothetical protein